MLLAELPTWLPWSTVLLLGLCFGSFLNVVIYRLPKDMSLSLPPSTCPKCGTRIAARHNLPVVSWLLLRGKATCCGTPISARYPIVELLGGILALLTYLEVDATFAHAPIEHALVNFALRFGLSLVLLAIAAIDYDSMIIPDSLSLGGAVVGLVAARFGLGSITLAESVDAAIGGYLIVWFPFIYLHEKWRGFAGMGLGDAKLLLLAGCWFGWLGVFMTLFAGAIQGTVFTLGSSLLGFAPKEPKGLTEEREEWKRAIEAAEGEEKARLQAEFDSDPALREIPEGEYGAVRIAFGPFLALALIELVVVERPLRMAVSAWLLGAF